jgi:hypothetical protein
MPAFHESAMEEMMLLTISRKPLLRALNIFVSCIFSKKVPVNIPMKREVITFLVMKARAMATKGGRRVKKPKLSAVVGVSLENVNIDRIKNETTK